MYERIAITLFVLIIAGTGMWFVRRRGIQRAQNTIQHLGITPGVPTIVYFWSTGCYQCRTAQKPILERMVEEYGEEHLQLISYNLDESFDIAKEWGVMTIPSTFIVDQNGDVLFANNGLATDGMLRRQLKIHHIPQGEV
ncbi:MAG: thioredoxin family protein [Desulfobacterales bacterium]